MEYGIVKKFYASDFVLSLDISMHQKFAFSMLKNTVGVPNSIFYYRAKVRGVCILLFCKKKDNGTGFIFPIVTTAGKKLTAALILSNAVPTPPVAILK